MHIVFAADHAGFALKEQLKTQVATWGHSVTDVGAHTLNDTDDYVDFCAAAATLVQKNPDTDMAIVVGGSGQGEAIVANRFAHVRAVVWNGASVTSQEKGLDEIALSREHNNANVLSIGARFVTTDEAIQAVQHWLSIPFSKTERHVRRLEKLSALGGIVPTP